MCIYVCIYIHTHTVNDDLLVHNLVILHSQSEV